MRVLKKNIAEQLELELDEDLENIKITLAFLEANGLLESVNESDFLLPKVCESIGKEGTSAERVRKHRQQKALQCNTDETKCNTEIEIEKERETEKKLLPPLDSYSKAWNELAEVYKLQKILKLTDKRKTKLKKRISETTDFVAVFNNCMKKIATSEFLKGNNNRGWKIDFDFIIENDTNYVNILEGKYDGK